MLPVKEVNAPATVEAVRVAFAEGRASTLVVVLSGIVAYVALRPELGLGHELAVAAVASVFLWASPLGRGSPSSNCLD